MGTSARMLEESLQSALDGFDIDEDVLEAVLTVETFDDQDMHGNGLILTLSDGSEFHITIKKVA